MSSYDMTPQKMEKWFKEEQRGQGDLKDYKPGLTNRDVPSKGNQSRIKGFVSGRRCFFQSDLEADLFRPLDLSPYTRDIKEQYPLLPLEETLDYASSLGIEHPKDPNTGCYIVMTTDLLWCLGKDEEAPIDCKPSAELSSERKTEKFEIVRTYWAVRNRQWKVSSELNVPVVLIKNCQRFHNNVYLDGLKIGVRESGVITRLLAEQVSQRERVLNKITFELDERLGLREGTCLRVAFHLMARRYWTVDWYSPQEGGVVINLQRFTNDIDFSKSFEKPWLKG